jgi:hypothetical protein
MKTYQVWYECPIQVSVRVRAKNEEEAHTVAFKRAAGRFGRMADSVKLAKAGEAVVLQCRHMHTYSRGENYKRLVEKRINERTRP